MPHAFTEDQLVEQPAIGLFADFGWSTVSAMEEVLGATGTLGRETQSEVVLLPRLRAALEKPNSTLLAEAIATAINELTRDRGAMLPAGANRDVYLLLKNGVQVSVPDHERGGQKIERVRVIDWDHPSENDFLLVSQLSVTGTLYTCRPDLVGFVNGLPLVVIELPCAQFQRVPPSAEAWHNLRSARQSLLPFSGSGSLTLRLREAVPPAAFEESGR